MKLLVELAAEFKGMPPHVFAECRRMPSGALAVHCRPLWNIFSWS